MKNLNKDRRLFSFLKTNLKMKLAVIFLLFTVVQIQSKSYPRNTTSNEIVENAVNEGQNFLNENISNLIYETKIEDYKTYIDQREIRGKVTDENDLPLLGATIVVKGTSVGTTTDLDGNFTLNVPAGADTLVISYVGYGTVEILLEDTEVYNISLTPVASSLDEVVVVGVGYGTLQKREVTNAIASVKSEDFVKGSINNVAELVQGKVAGLLITTTSGSPTASPEILLRGVGTLMSGVSPLVIVDGIPGTMDQVAPEDIESIDVLKDGSAAAIYGTRGSNGVILITTKKIRRETATTLEVTSYLTTDRITKRLEFLDANDIRNLISDGNPFAVDNGFATDWQDLIFQNPFSQNHNVSIRSGDARSSYMANVNFKGTEGLIKRSDNNVMTARLEMTHSMFDNKLKANANIIGRFQNYYPGSWNDVYEQAITRDPTDRAVDDDGNWVEYPARNRYENPMAHLYEKNGEVKNTTLKAYGNISYEIIPGLVTKFTGSIENFSSLSGMSWTHNHINNIKNGQGGAATRSTSQSETKVFESTLQYKGDVDEKFSYTLLLGHSWQENVYESFNGYNHLFPTDVYTWNNIGAGQGLNEGTATLGSYKESSKLIGAFFRANVNYDNKYLFMATVRREGSSKFGDNHKWGVFYAGSAGWNLMNEEFMQDNETFSALKLRIGYGLTGTIPSDPYNSLRKLTYDNSGFVFNNGQWITGLIATSNPNPDLRWEKKAETNIGIDFGFWDNRLIGSFDLYKRKTTDIIWNYPVPSPPNLYTSVIANAGSMENQGIEITISGDPIKTDEFTWTSSANYSTNKNKLISLSNEEFENNNPYINAGDAGRATREYTHKLEEGGPIGNFYGYKSIGVDDDGFWLVDTPEGPKLLLDAVEADKQILGNGVPKHYVSWNNSMKYKNFDLNVTMRGAFDYQILNQAQLLHGVPSEFRRSNVLKNSFEGIYGQLSMNQDATYVSHFLEQGDFWKIDNVTLGYEWSPGERINFIKKFRFFTSLTNVLTITSYSGIDPEVSLTNLSARAPGIDYVKRYPATRTYTLGITVTF